ncbi:MAG: oxygen-dependent coproporphyrinogen oxidase [Planctomycetes bacterium]|nr:oxygen-dependent coproporphyrinogen oxidase [Planctomycetota bacterium]
MTQRFQSRCAAHIYAVQDRLTQALAGLDGRPFSEYFWQRPGGGGGRTRILQDGNLFEKGGVNASEVFGELNDELARQLPGEGREFYATGISLVLHPGSPMVPTVHCNFRFVQKGNRWWFGGGADLTPYYLFEEDARHFHAVWKEVCDRHHPEYYGRFKKQCDEYFFLPHRGEARGLGGIFFDYLEGDFEALFRFWTDAAGSFLKSYVPIAEKRRGAPYRPEQRQFQLFRRGRYVEFNLLYDRGTVFGLKTGGRAESILMSLPPEACFPYDYTPAPGSWEEKLLEALRQPRDWV